MCSSDLSGLLAGGGLKKGVVYGKSDALATEPEEDPVFPEDLATTVYKQLGIIADISQRLAAIVVHRSEAERK